MHGQKNIKFRGIVVDYRNRRRGFLFSKASRSSLGLIQFSVQSVPEVMRTGRVADHVYLVPKLRMNGVILLPPTWGSLTCNKDIAS